LLEEEAEWKFKERVGRIKSKGRRFRPYLKRFKKIGEQVAARQKAMAERNAKRRTGYSRMRVQQPNLLTVQPTLGKSNLLIPISSKGPDLLGLAPKKKRAKRKKKRKRRRRR